MSKRWRERLERQNQLFDAALSNMMHGLSMFDEDSRLILCNRVYQRMYALPDALVQEGTPRSAILEHCRQLGFYPVDIAAYEAIAQAAIRTGQPAVANVPLTDGRVIKISHAPTDARMFVVTHLDVTDKVRGAEELARARDTLEIKVRERTSLIWRQAEALERLLAHEREINDNQQQFVTMASHEFRTPLTIIDGAAQRLLRRQGHADPVFVAEKAQQIRASAARIIDLIESILETGRQGAGRGQLEYGTVDLRDLIRSCCDRQAGIARSHGFEIDLDALPPSIEGDRSALDQVFTNLLSNAVKYSPGAALIEVRGWMEDEIVHVAVRDAGVGIDPEDLPKMFQRYFRARTSTGIAGTGLGLHLVRQLVEMHQGVIEVASEPGRGSTFTVRLPTTRPLEAAIAAIPLPAL